MGRRVCPKDVLMDQLFGYEDGVTNPANNLKVTISNLRRILKQVGEAIHSALRRGSRGPAVTLHYKMAPVSDMSPQQWKSGSVNWD